MVRLFSFVLVRRTTRDNPVALVCFGFVNAMLVVFEAAASSILLVSTVAKSANVFSKSIRIFECFLLEFLHAEFGVIRCFPCLNLVFLLVSDLMRLAPLLGCGLLLLAVA